MGIRLRLSSEQARHCGGRRELDIEAADFPALREILLQRFPSLPEELIDDMVVAIDGEIVHRPMLQQLAPDAELVFIGRITAG